MRRQLSSYLKLRKVERRLILVIVLIFLFILINGALLYTIDSDNSYFAFMKKVIPFPVILVGRSIITMADFNREIFLTKRLYEDAYKINFSKDENRGVLQEMKNNVREALINREVIKYISEKLDINVNSSEVNKEYEKVEGKVGGQENMKNVLEFASGWDVKDLKEKIYNNLLEQRVKENLIYQVKLNIISIIPENLSDENSSNEVYKKIGEIRQDIVDKKISFDEAKERYAIQGELMKNEENQEYYYLYELPDVFVQAVSSLSLGEISDIIKGDSGYYIVKLEGSKGSYKQRFEDFLQEQRKQIRILILAPGIRS